MNRQFQDALWYRAGRIAGMLRPRWRKPRSVGQPAGSSPGISVVIPSRNGRVLLEAQLAGIAREMEGYPAEIIVVDNGSDDGTVEWLAAWPRVGVEISATPLSFAAAVNRGIARAAFSHVCLLNNDMLLAPGFFRELQRAFECVPNLFCATAQIHFPTGVRREETGKAVMAQAAPDDFPVRCDEPLPGEDLTWVLYGSGGCSLYDAAKLRALGGVDEAYAPAYVEDLDLGYRAWQRGWPTVYVAGAAVEHRHRATTSRYFTEERLAEILETNYLKFLARAVTSREVFRRLWTQALGRLLHGAEREPARRKALRRAARIALGGGPAAAVEYPEEMFLALTNGDVAVFPGLAGSGKTLITFVERLAAPSPEMLAAHPKVVQVRSGNHLAFRAATALDNLGNNLGTDTDFPASGKPVSVPRVIPKADGRR